MNESSKIYQLHFIIHSSQINLRMHRIIICLNLQLISRLIRIWLLFKLYNLLFWIVLQMYNITCRICKWLKFTIILFFITTPWISIRTYEIISMTSVRIVEHIIWFLYCVYMADTNTNPWCKFYYAYTPSFYCLCFYFYNKNLLDKQGSKISNLSLPEVVILACVGLTIVILFGLRSSEKNTLTFLSY